MTALLAKTSGMLRDLRRVNQEYLRSEHACLYANGCERCQPRHDSVARDA